MPTAPERSVQDLALQALADSPEYIRHICALFGSCSEHLRMGADQEAMRMLARATDDLQQFTLLVDMVVDIAQSGEAMPFRRELDSCVRDLEQALVADDLIGVSDGIEQTLLPLLPRWDAIAEDISASIAVA